MKPKKTGKAAPLRKNPERNRDIIKRIPAGRWGRPEDLLGVVVFLALSSCRRGLPATSVPGCLAFVSLALMFLISMIWGSKKP